MSTMMRRAAAAALVLLATYAAARPCGAAIVTWHFIEADGGGIGGLLSINSPPVDLTAGSPWTAFTADVVDFQILDPNIGPVGPYTINLNVASQLDGLGPDLINDREVSGEDGAGNVAIGHTSSTPGSSNLGVFLATGGSVTLNGDWVLAAAVVPEPSSLVMAASGALIGAGSWHRRRRRAVATA